MHTAPSLSQTTASSLTKSALLEFIPNRPLASVHPLWMFAIRSSCVKTHSPLRMTTVLCKFASSTRQRKRLFNFPSSTEVPFCFSTRPNRHARNWRRCVSTRVGVSPCCDVHSEAYVAGALEYATTADSAFRAPQSPDELDRTCNSNSSQCDEAC